MEWIKKIFKGDGIIWTVFFILCAISIIEVFSASSILTLGKGDPWKHFTQQVVFVILGIGVVWLVHLVPHKMFKPLGGLGLVVSWILLLTVLFFGKSVNGASRSLSLLGIEFQPLELAKLTLIVSVAVLMSRAQEYKDEVSKTFKYILWLTGLTCLLIITENLSTVLLIMIVVYLFMWIGQMGWKRMLALTGAGTLAGGLFFLCIMYMPQNDIPVLERIPTWRNRLMDDDQKGVLAAEYKITDANRQVTHARIAIATSNVIGKGPGRSEQRDSLSNGFSDYIYAIILEEMGLVGGIFVLFLYMVLLFRAVRIANKCGRTFPAFLVMGLSLMIVVQALFSMAVSVGLIVTGQPLPLISKGGTSMVITSAYIGIILSVSRYVEKLEKAQQEAALSGSDTPTAALLEAEQESDGQDVPFDVV